MEDSENDGAVLVSRWRSEGRVCYCGTQVVIPFRSCGLAPVPAADTQTVEGAESSQERVRHSPGGWN